MLSSARLALVIACVLTTLFCLYLRANRREHYPIFLGASVALVFVALPELLDSLFEGAGEAGIPLWRAWLGLGTASLACLAFAYTLNRFLDRFVWFGRLRDGENSKVPNILIGLARLGIYGGAAMFITSWLLQRDVTAIVATSGVVAIVLGYSLQPTLSEVFAGLALNLSRPFRTGDSIQVDGVWGVIQDANWRSVTLRTYEGAIVVLPNSKVASQRLTNMDLPDRNMRHHIRFVVDIDIPPGQVRDVAVSAMKAMPQVLPLPEPRFLFKDVTEYGVAYEAIFWHADPNLYIYRRDEVGTALWYAFRRAGIPFSVLRHDLALPEVAVVPPMDPAHQEARLRDILRRSALFRALDDAAIDALVAGHRHLVFGPSERIVRQQEPGSSMFVIIEGEAAVYLERAEGSEHQIATLCAGETFGQMSLMTGEPRSATVRAMNHLVLAEIKKADVAPLLEANPALVEDIAKQIVAIQAENEGHRQRGETDPEVSGPGQVGLFDKLLSISSRIRGFFQVQS